MCTCIRGPRATLIMIKKVSMKFENIFQDLKKFLYNLTKEIRENTQHCVSRTSGIPTPLPTCFITIRQRYEIYRRTFCSEPKIRKIGSKINIADSFMNMVTLAQHSSQSNPNIYIHIHTCKKNNLNKIHAQHSL